MGIFREIVLEPVAASVLISKNVVQHLHAWELLSSVMECIAWGGEPIWQLDTTAVIEKPDKDSDQQKS